MDIFNDINLLILLITGIVFYIISEYEEECLRGNIDYSFFMNSEHSWTAKYKFPIIPYKRKWYHFGIYPALEERFPYSTTLFVFLMYMEHFLQFLKFRVLEIGLLLIDWRFAAAWFVGSRISSFIKEAFLKIA